ncbi:uncharacterized protein [Clytia hemisphaerica]|uniref:Cnidarian restricted protein n=1 Tax=Clytia hemisphaerica TaxID=252671 RepID=A0A7M5X7T5_9CNID
MIFWIFYISFLTLKQGSSLNITQESCQQVNIKLIYSEVKFTLNEREVQANDLNAVQMCMMEEMTGTKSCYKDCHHKHIVGSEYSIRCQTGTIYDAREIYMELRYQGHVYPMNKGKVTSYLHVYMTCDKEYLSYSEPNWEIGPHNVSFSLRMSITMYNTVKDIGFVAKQRTDGIIRTRVGRCNTYNFMFKKCSVSTLQSCLNYSICVEGNFTKSLLEPVLVYRDKCYDVTTRPCAPQSIQYNKTATNKDSNKSIIISWKQPCQSCHLKQDLLRSEYWYGDNETRVNGTTNNTFIKLPQHSKGYRKTEFHVRFCMDKRVCSKYTSILICNGGYGKCGDHMQDHNESTERKVFLSIMAALSFLIVGAFVFLILKRMLKNIGYTNCRQDNKPFIERSTNTQQQNNQDGYWREVENEDDDDDIF